MTMFVYKHVAMMETQSKPRITFFVGKNTPIKRYRAYFPQFQLVEPNNDLCSEKVILCHSLGLHKALEICDPPITIVCMDGTALTSPPPEGVSIIMFRPLSKQGRSDDCWMHDIQYYKEDTHYPYMVKRIRDAIVRTVHLVLHL